MKNFDKREGNAHTSCLGWILAKMRLFSRPPPDKAREKFPVPENSPERRRGLLHCVSLSVGLGFEKMVVKRSRRDQNEGV